MSNHIFFPIDYSYFVQQYKENFSIEFEKDEEEFTYPINIMSNPFFEIDSILSDILELELPNDAAKKNSLIMQAPDEIIDFSTLDFSLLISLKKLSPQLKKEIELKEKFGLEKFSKSYFLTKFQMILPIFIRCSNDEVTKKEYIETISLILREFPDHPIATVLRILIYSRMILISKNPNEIKFNLENSLIKINLLIQTLCENERKGQDEELITNIFPFLLPKVTEIVYAASFFSFDNSNDTEPTKFHLYQLLGQFFVLIASNYPPSFCKTGFQTFSKYFSRIGSDETIESKNYPDYSFIIKFPHLVEPNVVSTCVTDLLNSFGLLSYLGLNLNGKKDQVYGVLIKLMHWNQSFCRSAARSLINLSRFPFFKNAINEFKQDLESSERDNLAATLYLLMSSYNYTEDFVRFELKSKISSILIEKTNIGANSSKRKHLDGFQKLIQSNTTNITSIFEAAQLVNGLSIQYCNEDNQNLADLALILHGNQFLRCLETFLTEYIQKKTFLDLKFAQPFIVLASRYIQIRSLIVSNTNIEYLGISIEMILNLYSAILLAGPLLTHKKQQFTTLSSDLYISRSIISNSISKNCPRFLFIASEFVNTKRMSLLDPFLLFLSDYFSFNSFDPNLYIDICDNLVEFTKIALLTESVIICNSLINMLVELCEKASYEILDSLISMIIKQLELQFKNYTKSKEEPRNSAKILYIIREISSKPKGKLCIIFNSSSLVLCDVLHSILQDREIASSNKELTIVDLQTVTNLMSPALTVSRDLDFILRCGSELLPNYWLENIITAICFILNIDMANSLNDDVLINAIIALRYSCENPFIVNILKEVSTFRLNINELDKKAKVFKKREFYIPLLELTNAIAKVDSEYAFELIGLSSNQKTLCKPNIKDEKISGEIYNMFRKGVTVNKYPKMLLSAIQKHYNKTKDSYNDEKLKRYSNPLPPNSTTNYMGDLPKDFYEEYSETAYKKKK